MWCFKVTVKCIYPHDRFTVSQEGHYYTCVDGVCYCIAYTIAEIEKAFSNTENIISIERIGKGYIPEQILNKKLFT